MKLLGRVLLLSGIFLLLLNFYVINTFGLEGNRWVRLATTCFYFLVYLFATPKKDKFILSAFVLFVLSDILLFYYEMPLMKKATFVLVILAYISLMLHILPYIKNLKASLYQKIIFVGVLAINVVMLYFLVDMVEYQLNDTWNTSLFYLYGMCMIVLVIMAFSFSNRYSNQASFFFMCATLGFVFSDITSFIAYYMELHEFYFPDRVFYLLGLITLVKFTGLDKKEGMLQTGEYI